MSKVPLYIVTGASGSGKTTVIKELRRLMPDYDVFDYDDIIPFINEDKARFNKETTHLIQNIWLRVARDIAESGRITILCGIVSPKDIEKCEDLHYFSHIYYLILHCDDKTRETRLRTRKRMTEQKIQSNLKLARSFIKNADKYSPPMPIVDTSKTDAAKVAKQIKEWVQEQKVFI
ncbi:AAA family ATPase [Paenibacillus sp. GCM10027628]|uniref:AAA family ATPase n=1 Tax=Paenibacillus sp. GCM10027628 TaxID=3273413 RepID=UPI003640ED7F